jgi:DUF4097 and DUF4098 domain-containing protein YvlB
MAGGSRSGWKMSVYEGTADAVPPAHLEVFVPRRAQIWIKTSSATITARDVAGNVDFNTIEGRIEVRGAPTELRAETMRGDVAIHGTPRWMRVKSGAGSIVFEGSATDAGLSSVSGAITASSRFDRARIETVSGDVRIAGPLGATSMIDIDTHSGPVSVAFDAPVNGNFLLFSVTGPITNMLAPVRTSVKKGGAGGVQEFIVGSVTGARVTVRTFEGSITLAPK